MGPEFPLPERTFSWEELGGQRDAERPSQAGSVAWRIVAALMFVNGLALSAYAFRDGYWWLWVAMAASFVIVGAMASRAVSNMIRDGELDPAAPATPPQFTPRGR